MDPTSIVALVVAGGSLSRVVWVSGRHEGKLETILTNLEKISADHETRLTNLERDRRHDANQVH